MSNIKRGGTYGQNRIQNKDKILNSNQLSAERTSPYNLNDYCKLLLEYPLTIQKSQMIKLFNKFGCFDDDLKILKQSGNINTGNGFNIVLFLLIA